MLPVAPRVVSALIRPAPSPSAMLKTFDGRVKLFEIRGRTARLIARNSSRRRSFVTFARVETNFILSFWFFILKLFLMYRSSADTFLKSARLLRCNYFQS